MKWERKQIGEIANVLSGSTPSSTVGRYWKGENVWVTPADLGKLEATQIRSSERKITNAGVDSCNLPKIPAGAVVMSSRAPIGHLAIAGCDLYTNQGCKSFDTYGSVSNKLLYYILMHRINNLQQSGSGATFAEVSKSFLENFEISFPSCPDIQKGITETLDSAFEELSTAITANKSQLKEVIALSRTTIAKSLSQSERACSPLGEVLEEIKQGIGDNWKKHRVLGATKNGLALAKEPPGKNPQRYKPVTHGTIFYNPMRIMIGSIAFVDEDDTPGITSPDYVVLKGKEGVVDSRWFYYWLRSSYGERCIQSLARGAVRERMLFNRLAEGTIELPNYDTQLKASKALAEIKPMQQAIEKQLQELELIPQKLLAQVFEK